jgi:hypothetical protein
MDIQQVCQNCGAVLVPNGHGRKCSICGIECSIHGLKRHEDSCRWHKTHDSPRRYERFIERCQKRRVKK